VPDSVTLPSRAVASTPSGTVMFAASALFAVRQQHLQVIVHVGHAGDALRRGGRLQVLRIVRHGAIECHLPGDVLHGDV